MNESNVLYSIVLGIVQGIGEFLPISSSGHLVVVSSVMDGKPLPLSLNIALHIGTLAAVLVYFWRDWLNLALRLLGRVTRGEKSFESDVLFPILIIGTIPAAIVGLAWEKEIEAIFHNPVSVAVPLALVGVLIWWGDIKSPSRKVMTDLTYRDGFLIGVAQAMALVPGVSRSGITILCGRVLSYRKEDAAKFSFMLGTPAMLGAAILDADQIMQSMAQADFYVGIMVSMVVGCLAIRFLLSFLRRFGFGAFAIYRLLLAAVILAVAL